MTQTRAIRMLVAAVCTLAAAAAMGCANPGGGDGGYYRRGTVHYDAFPPGYVPGGHHGPGYGRHGYGYGRHGW